MLNPETIEAYKAAGKVSHTLLHAGAKKIVPGASMREILDWIEDEIKKAGMGIAFPAQISLNNTAAHFCPTDEEDVTFKEGDVAKLDIGVHNQGFIADNAVTVDLGDNAELLAASKEALNEALKIVAPGTTLSQLGRTIQETIQSHGYSPIHNLSGHGLSKYEIHTKPNIPNVDTGDETELQEGQVIAIEPFASAGEGRIYESTNPTVFSLISNRPVRSPLTRDVLKTIKGYENLPFTTRWLSRIHGAGKTNYALQDLQRNGNLLAHPPLPDKGLVSQHEHSVIVAEKSIIYTRP